jgi:glycogen debranching enzyme
MNDELPAGAAEEHPPPAPPVEFYIPATSSLQVRRPRTLKHGDTFGVFDHYGDVVPAEGGTEGIYHQDTRYLSGLQLLVNGRRPLLLSSIVQDNNALLTADLTNPDFFDAAGRLLLPKDAIHIVRAKFIWQTRAYERLAVRNFDSRPHTIRLTLQFQADFADLFEVRGHERAARGSTSRSRTRGSRVTSAARSCNSRPRQAASRWARRYSSCRCRRRRACRCSSQLNVTATR